MFQALKDSKRFNIDLMSLDLPDLDRYTYRFDDGKTERYYRLDDNHYFASVTTMMGEWKGIMEHFDNSSPLSDSHRGWESLACHPQQLL